MEKAETIRILECQIDQPIVKNRFQPKPAVTPGVNRRRYSETAMAFQANSIADTYLHVISPSFFRSAQASPQA
jgi:hypothetical protein